MVKEDKSKSKTISKKTTTKKVTGKKDTTKKVDNKKVGEKVKTKKVEPKKEINSGAEENNYTKTILAAVLIILVLVAGYIGHQIKNNGEDSGKVKGVYTPTEDEKRFKEEYESINGIARSNGSINRNVSIMEDNNIEYVSIDQAADIIEKGSGIIYFGFAACPWCRNAVPILLDAMASTNLDKIYYVDVRPNDDSSKDIREQYQVVQNKVRRTRAASSPRYDDVLNMLSDYLEDYIVQNDKGKKFDTGKKVLGAPTVVAVKNGVVLDVHNSTVEGHIRVDGKLDDLTKEQINDLYNIYTNLITKYLEDSCHGDTQC